MAVVLAADRVGGAGVAASDADNADGGAVEADGDVEVLEDDTEQAQDGGGRSRVSLLITVSVSAQWEAISARSLR